VFKNKKSNFRWLFERSAASAQRVPPDSRRQTRFFGDFVVANNKVTLPPGRTPGLCQQSHSKNTNKKHKQKGC